MTIQGPILLKGEDEKIEKNLSKEIKGIQFGIFRDKSMPG